MICLTRKRKTQKNKMDGYKKYIIIAYKEYQEIIDYIKDKEDLIKRFYMKVLECYNRQNDYSVEDFIFD